MVIQRQSESLTGGVTTKSICRALFLFASLIMSGCEEDIPTITESQPLESPTLLLEAASSTGSYIVRWTKSKDATSYELHEDETSSFSSPSVVYAGPDTLVSVSSRPFGTTFYYRVRAIKGAGNSSWSATQAIAVVHPTFIDPMLFGEWYYLDTMSISIPSPNVAFRGIQIANNDTVHSLGIETETGRIGFLEGEPRIRLRRASYGLIVMEYYSTWQIIDSMQYTVSPDTLIMSQGPISTTYVRTQLGYPFSTPVHCVLDVRIDNAPARNPRVALYPSAHVSRVSLSELRLRSDVPEGWIVVTIDSFAGSGTYPIGPNKGTYTIWMGDVGLTLKTDSTAIGTITIDEYDEAINRCSGTFEFITRHRALPSDPWMVRTLTEGAFSLPLYR